MSNINQLVNPFEFSEVAVRTALQDDGTVYFCAKDVCAVLGIRWSGRGNTLRSIPEEWVGVSYHETPGGVQETIFISEPAVYKLIFRSSKPKAVEFANWVCGEVLPAIRKQGFYGTISGAQRLAFSKQITAIIDRLVSTKDAMAHQFLIGELRELCNLIGRPVPDLQLLGKDYQQLAMDV